MAYTEQQINNRINAIKSRYANFEMISIQKQDDSGIYFFAKEFDGQEYRLRLNSTGRLYHKKYPKWSRVDNFMYRDENE